MIMTLLWMHMTRLHLLAVVAALGLQADVGCVALIVGGVGGHIPAGQRIGRRGRAAQVLLAGAVLLEIHQSAAGDAAHLSPKSSAS